MPCENITRNLIAHNEKRQMPHCHPYSDEVAIGCHGIGVREEEDFVLIIRTIFFIILKVGEASLGKS